MSDCRDDASTEGSSMSTPSVKRTERLLIWGLLLGIFAVGMALRLHDLDADSLWMDEIDTAIWEAFN